MLVCHQYDVCENCVGGYGGLSESGLCVFCKLGVGVFRHADVVCLCLVCILWQFCMTCSLLMLIEDAIGDHTEEAYSRAGLITAL